MGQNGWYGIILSIYRKLKGVLCVDGNVLDKKIILGMKYDKYCYIL